ncbi:MAG TPA: MFS transporter [Candidatus Angelobacter sp.]|nr:MFS transporter [Candidatus Angelobacter sp.]
MPPKLYPRLLLAVLTGLNILNYVDRNVLFGVQPLIKAEFHVTDAQIGTLTSVFFFAYMIAAPLIGWMGDRFPRKHIVVLGIALWSGFTFLTWLVHDYNQLLLRHTIVGIGEASYAAIAPTLIADSFPVERRGRMLSIFFLGLPLGSALGIMLGGPLGEHFGWRWPFMMAGIPGFLLALLLWFLPEPPRGKPEEGEGSLERSTLKGLLKNGAFITASLGMAAYTFAVGGLQVWIPTFLVRLRGLSVSRAAIIFGLIAAVNGIVATLIGGWIGDRQLKRKPGAYYTFSGVNMLIAIPFMVLAVYVAGKLMFPIIFVAVFFLLIGTGPSNAAVVNSVDAKIRSSALAVNIFVIHLLGDASSPWVIGKISDITSLQTGFWAAFAAAALSGGILLYGAKFAPRFKTQT